MTSSVTFGQLGQLLLDLGFEDQTDEYLVFRHATPGALVRMALHEASEPVLERDLVKVRKLLELTNLLECDKFDQWVLESKRQHEAAAG